MMRSLSSKIKQAKQDIKASLPQEQVSRLRLAYNLIKNPRRMKGHLNRFRYEQGLLRKAEIDFSPPIFVPMISDNCNLRCPTCLYLLRNPDKFNRNYISPDKFRRMLEKYNSRKTAEVIFLSGGEPLMHPQLDELVDIAKEYSALVKISTNGVLVKKRIASLSRLDYVNVSMDAYDYASYKEYRGGSEKQFDLVLEGLKALKAAGVYFSVSYLLWTENLPAIDKMLELAYLAGPDFVSFHNINPHGCEQYSPLTAENEQVQAFLQKMVQRSDYPFGIDLPVIFDLNSPLFGQARCIQPWYYFCFSPRGEVSYCCHLAHDADIGNVFADYNFNSPQMVNFRRRMMQEVPLESCRWCQRRFMGQEFGSFDAKVRKWFLKLL